MPCAGPGSPQWHEAVAKLRAEEASGPRPQATEYQLILRAREDLSSGRRYREVRAGTGFTHKLLEGLENEQSGGTRRSMPTATIVAVLAILAILAVLAVVGWKMTRAEPNRGAIDELAVTYFPNETTKNFDKAIPAGWNTVGQLPLEAAGGLRAGSGANLLGGGVVADTAIPASQSFAFEADLRLTHPSDAVVAQVFISTSGDFSPDRATSGHELVWQLIGSSQQVAINGNTEPPVPAPTSGVLRIRLTMSRDLAIVEADGKRIWAGSHSLGDAPRIPGVRFIRKSPGEGGPIVQSLKLLK